MKIKNYYIWTKMILFNTLIFDICNLILNNGVFEKNVLIRF